MNLMPKKNPTTVDIGENIAYIERELASDSDSIRRSDAIKAVWGAEDINPSEDGQVFEAQSHIDRDIRLIPAVEPCKDAISRAVAIKAVSEPYNEKFWDYVSRPISNVVNILKSIPAVEPKQAWIPCEERLPEDKCDVLIQFGWNMAVGYIDGGDWRINSGDNWCTDVAEDDGKPIAWMPLPEPWKGADDEQV